MVLPELHKMEVGTNYVPVSLVSTCMDLGRFSCMVHACCCKSQIIRC